jgi:hypothetical protein
MNDRICRLAFAACALLFGLLEAAPLHAGGSPARSGWAELSALAPGTAIIVELNDGRRLERYLAGTTADELVVLDLSAVASSDRRQKVLDLLRKSPQDYLTSVYVEESGQQIPVVQRFDRGAIRLVAKVKPLPFTLNKTVTSLLLNWSGPCPNCDASQTWAGRKDTVVPSPRPARHAGPLPEGEMVYLAPPAGPNPLDDMAWEQWRMLLPAGLRR